MTVSESGRSTNDLCTCNLTYAARTRFSVSTTPLTALRHAPHSRQRLESTARQGSVIVVVGVMLPLWLVSSQGLALSPTLCWSNVPESAMFPSRLSKQVAAKAFLATILLSALAGLAGAHIAPQVPLQMVLLYSAAGAVLAFTVLVIATVAVITLMQFILRKGGTDPQWFWFSAEPPGLVQLRQQASRGTVSKAPEH